MHANLIRAIAAAALLMGLAASSAGCAAASSSSPQPVLAGPTGMGPPRPTVHDPLPGASKVSLARAGAALGAPLVLPDTPVVNRSGVGQAWLKAISHVNIVAVTFPQANVWLTYQWPVSYDGGYIDSLVFYRRLAAPIPGHGTVAILNGTPAFADFHNWKGLTGSAQYLTFAAGGVEITVMGRQSMATIEAIVRSIVDRSPKPPPGQLGNVGGVQIYPYLSPASARQISLSDASSTLGAPVVLPDSALASRDSAQAWAEGSCPHPGGWPPPTRVCAVWVSFASGLSVGYSRPPAFLDTANEVKSEAAVLARRGDSAEAIRLNGIPALAIDEGPAKRYPGRIEFDLGQTRVVVAGDYGIAELRAVAQSIVDRSRHRR